MARQQRRRPFFPHVETLEPRDAPTASQGLSESFDGTAPGQLPVGWSQWDSSSAASFTVASGQALSAPNSLVGSSTTSTGSARAWVTDPQPADVQVSAAVYLNTLIPGQVIARGSNLGTSTPTYYALSITRGLQLQLLRVVNGVSTVLGQLTSVKYFSGQWVRVTLSVSGTSLRAQVFRLDQSQYLNSDGTWGPSATWALSLTDAGISGDGQVGLVRAAGYTNSVSFDDFATTPAGGDNQAPTVSISSPAGGATLSGVVPVQVAASDNVAVTRVEFYLDGVLRAAVTAAPYTWNFDTSVAANGSHTLSVWAYDAAGNIGRASVAVTTQNNNALPRPTIPQHYEYIRLAELAYSGTPLDAFATQLLQNSIDLVVPDTSFLSAIQAITPNTPQLIYSNFSNLYLGLLTDWLSYADAHGLSREEAFYHVASATPFSGNSGSSQPVNWFWAVYRGSTSWTNLTSQARGSNAGGVAFAPAGQAVDIGYPERFREINVNLTSPAAAGWSAVLEYPTAVDASGNSTAWKTLTPISDGTAGLTASGRITFDPPPDWVPASINGSARLYYVRFRTTSGGTAPVAATVLGRDYVGASGGTSGTIPAFDSSADVNHDGYLSDAEYANRKPGLDARFAYESRLFAPGYGQMRFATDPSDAGFKAWAADYAVRFLQGQPVAGGLFVDNSSGSAPAAPGSVLEPISAYGSDYAALLNAVGQAIAPRWILANTTGTGTTADPVIQAVQGAFEEFALRPLSGNYQQFEDLASLVAHQQALTSPAPYLVLDSLPAGGSPTDPRTQLATLAEYYLLADPKTTFLDFYGGFAPATSWSQHWSGAVTYNIGQPLGGWSLAASGADPSNPALTYRVYQRAYDNALVLYRPLSYAAGGATGSLADASATTIALGGTYYPVQADGTLGAAVTSVTLRNGEGAILVKSTPAAGTPFTLGGLPASAGAGQTTTVTVTALDRSGHPNPAYTGTVHFTSSDGQAVLPADYTFTAADNGVHTFSITWKTAGAQTLTVTDTGTGTAASAGLTVTPGPATQLALGASGPVTAGQAVTVTLTARDAFNNVATGYAGTVHWTSSDGRALLPGDYTFSPADQGQHTFTLTLDTAGGQAVAVADTAAAGPAGSLAVTVAPAAADHFRLGAPATTVAGNAFDLTLTALDPFGNVATGYTGSVAFTSSDPLAGLPGGYTFTTGDAGTHTFVLGGTLRTAGSQTVAVADTTAAGLSGSASVAVSPGAAASLRVTVPATATAGSAFDVTVTALDAFGNTATGYTGAVALTSGDPKAVLPAAYTFTAADAGTHTFAAGVVLKTAGSQTVAAQDGAGLQAGGAVAVAPAEPAAALVLTGLSPTQTAGQPASFALTALDAYGNVLTDYAGTVSFTSADPQAVLPAPYTFSPADQGRHTFTVAWKTAGPQNLTVADTAAQLTARASVQVAPAAADHFAVAAPAASTAGAALTVTVTALDPFGNVATGYAGTVQLTGSDGQAVLPAAYAFGAADAGTHSFPVTLRTAGVQTITAADGAGLSSSASVTVAPAAASQLQVAGVPPSVQAGAAQPFTVRVLDPFGNTATGYAGTVFLISSDGRAVLPGPYTFVPGDQGVHTFSAVLKTAGAQTLTARDTAATLTSTTTSLTVTPAAAARLFVTARAGSVTAGTPVGILVTALDAFGNVATGYTGKVHFAARDPQAVLPAAYTFTAADRGTHTFTVTFKTAGVQAISVGDTTKTSVLGGTSVIVAPGPVSGFSLTLSSSGARVGSPVTLTVTARDAYGNVATGYTGTVKVTSSDKQAALPANY